MPSWLEIRQRAQKKISRLAAALQGPRNSEYPALLLLTLAAFFLRWFRLDFRSIWLDEAYSLKLSASGWKEIIRGAGMDIHPPLFHFLLAGWTRLFGTGEIAARSLSVVLGTALIPVFFFFAKNFSSRRAAWWTAALLAVSPFFIELSRMARMGALLALCSALALYFFWRFYQTGRFGHGLGYVLGILGALYTHYFGFLIFFSIHLFLFMGIGKLDLSRPWRKQWLILQLSVIMGYTFWLPHLWDHLHKGGPAWRGIGAQWWEPLHAFYGVWVGTACWTRMDKTLVLTAGGIALSLLILAIAPKVEAFYQSLKPSQWGFLITLMLVPLCVVWVYSWNRLNVFDNRYLGVVGLMLILVAGLALSWVPKPTAVLAGLFMLAGFAVPLSNQYFVYGYYDNWRSAAAWIKSQSRPYDRLAVYPAWNETPLDYYLRGQFPIQGIPGTYDSISGETLDYFPIDRESVNQLKSLFQQDRRLWLVLVNEGEEQSEVVEWFSSNYRLRSQKQLGGIWLGLWEQDKKIKK